MSSEAISEQRPRRCDQLPRQGGEIAAVGGPNRKPLNINGFNSQV